MKIKIIKGTVCGGKNVKKDQVVDASETDAKILIGLGKAIEPGKAKQEKPDTK